MASERTLEKIGDYKKGLLRIEDVILEMYAEYYSDILAKLSTSDSRYYENIKTELERQSERLVAKMKDEIFKAVDAAADVANSSINISINAAGVYGIPEYTVNTMLLSAIETKVVGVTSDAKLKIAGHITSGFISGDVSKAYDEIQKVVESNRRRAVTIMNTEANSALNMVSYERMREVAKHADVGKEWLGSGKIHARPSHAAASRQVVGIDEFFNIGGVMMLRPHDPNAPANQIINCGCSILPVVKKRE